MSRAIALVRFNDGTIVRGCYNGTSDFISEWLITDEGLKEKYDGFVFLGILKNGNITIIHMWITIQ